MFVYKKLAMHFRSLELYLIAHHHCQPSFPPPLPLLFSLSSSCAQPWP